MATYKVIQDIEAEDKLVGPLTLRQFIYAGVAAVCLYICFLCYTKHVTLLIGVFLPIAAVGTFFAFPWKGEQPTEIWALARLRFMLKPRVRIWNQSGVKDVVTITAPRKIEAVRPRTNNLSEYEVRSRLKALADTIDSRGWATRNASYGIYMQQQGNIVAPGAMPLAGIPAANDMFDEQGSVSQNFAAMLTRSQQDQRQRVLMQMAQAEAPTARPGAQTVIAPHLSAQNPNGPQLPQVAMPAMPMMPAAPQSLPVSQGPQLPPPIMPNTAMPNMPAPAAPSFVDTLEAGPAASFTPNPVDPASLAQPGAHLQSLLSQAGPAAMPPQAAPGVVPTPPASNSSAPANDYWFAGDTANNGQNNSLGNGALPTTPPPITPPSPPSGAPDGEPGAAADNQAQTPAPAAALPEPYAAAISSGKIMTDVPVAAASEPTPDEQAFGAAAREQGMAQQLNYSHMKVVQPAGTGVKPSVPGMIDYGRPQPVEDQMQYDTADSRPTLAPAAPKTAAHSIDQPPAKPVTPKPNPAILGLAKNDDLDVATIARQANRNIGKSPNEVEIRLH